MIIVRGHSQTTLTRQGRSVGGTVGNVNGTRYAKKNSFRNVNPR